MLLLLKMSRIKWSFFWSARKLNKSIDDIKVESFIYAMIGNPEKYPELFILTDNGEAQQMR